jgi:divalent metal cation (Fe/Co/Zn/Cd) transporter
LDTDPIAQVGHAIGGALTPAFLLAGMMTALRVLSERRNRVVDRVLAALKGQEDEHDVAQLRKRAGVALAAMAFCILASILVCALVAVVFLGLLFNWPLHDAAVALMLGAMLVLALGLLCFLIEATLARTDLPPH